MLYNGDIAYLQSGVQAGLVEESVDSLRNLLLLMVPIVLLLCVGGGYLLAGRALRPIESVTAELDAIGPTNLSSRLPVPPVADEVARLTRKSIHCWSGWNARRPPSAGSRPTRRMNCARRWRCCAPGWKSRSRASARAEENRAALGAAHREALSLCRIADELLMLSRLNGEVIGRSAAAESSRAGERDRGDGRAAGAGARDKAVGRRARGRLRQRQRGAFAPPDRQSARQRAEVHARGRIDRSQAEERLRIARFFASPTPARESIRPSCRTFSIDFFAAQDRPAKAADWA